MYSNFEGTRICELVYTMLLLAGSHDIAKAKYQKTNTLDTLEG